MPTALLPLQIGQYEEVLGTLLMFATKPGIALNSNSGAAPGSSTQTTTPATTPAHTATAGDPSSNTELRDKPGSMTTASADTTGNMDTSFTPRPGPDNNTDPGPSPSTGGDHQAAAPLGLPFPKETLGSVADGSDGKQTGAEAQTQGSNPVRFYGKSRVRIRFFPAAAQVC